MYTIDKVTKTYAWMEPMKTEKACQIIANGAAKIIVGRPKLTAKRLPINVNKTSPGT